MRLTTALAAAFGLTFALSLGACSGVEATPADDETTDVAGERGEALSTPESVVACGGAACGAKELCCTDCSGNRFCAFLSCPQFVCPPDAQAPSEADAVPFGSKCELSGGTCRKSACRANEVQSSLSCGTERGCCLPAP